MSGWKLEDSETGRSATQKATGNAAWVSNAVKYKIVTSDATGLDVASGPAILYGVILIAAGTMAGVYDALTVTGTAIIPSTAATLTFSGLGVICPTGITCDWSSGTWLVLYQNT
jgi:hypothetical protein